jgi:2-keto-4-pentenoate hydratase/2-oxohepta-3-ene-1,7-dioic acid hydratase in catechol pathway
MSDQDPYTLGRLRAPAGEPFTGVCIDEQVVPLTGLGLGDATVEELLADWATSSKALDAAVDELRASGRWAALALDLGGLSLLAPFVPGQIFQSGANYKTHVIQLQVSAARQRGLSGPDLEQAERDATALMQQRAETGTPYVFVGLPSSVCGPTDDVVLPPTGTQHDWELELGVVIGEPAYQVDRAQAWQHVAGYTIVNDLTTRDRVFRPDMPGLGTDWLAGKNAPTFLPVGPWLTPARFVADPMDLRITLALNGETMQDETTADMIFDIPRLIEHVSAITPLRPGDLLLTGSPAGNGAHYGRYLRPGDVMEASITGLGRQRNRCVAA